jgi:hypothetical protein
MKIKNFLENFIIFAIILVIIQTFCDELAIVLNWNIKTRNIITLSGLLFDLIFTIEFITRLIIASKKKQAGRYFFYERGWVDFLASIPLLILNSGPESLIIIFGASSGGLGVGFVNILKVVKAIRITRVLRLIRMLKIFGKIKNANSVMAQRHVSTISTSVCTSIIFVILILGLFHFPNTKELTVLKIERYKKQINGYITLSTKWGEVSLFEQLKAGLSGDTDIIKLSTGENTFSNYNNEYIKTYFSEDDFEEFVVGQVKISVSIKDIRKIESQSSLIFFIIIIFTIIVLMTAYSRHFVQNITDVIHVMNKGFDEKDYLLEVKIKPVYNGDEIFKLAEQYNHKWLTLKSRFQKEIYKEEEKHNDISVDDLF